MTPADTLSPVLSRFRTCLIEVPRQLSTFTETQLTQRTPGKWSRKEILGHLIDSAIHNLRRFTEATSASVPYQIQSYNQTKLVEINQYQSLPINHLVTLWSSLNQQILFVVERFPTDLLTKPVVLAPNDQLIDDEKSLNWLIIDYVFHLEHHLKTLLQLP